MDTENYIKAMQDTGSLVEPVLCSIIQALHLPIASQGLDAGCGIGLPALLLARAIGPEGHVIGLDILPELLSVGEKLVAKAGFSGRITFQEGDISARLPFADKTFDWVWSSDCIGNLSGELTPILKEAMRVLKPGGSIFIVSWSSQQLLPGYSLLEARLNATCSSYIPFLKGKSMEQHFLRAPHWFEEAGLQEVQARTLVGEVQAPLAKGERAALTSLFVQLWGQPQEGVSPEDWKEYQRLCTPGSVDFILDQPGYYAFFTYTLIQGKTPVAVD
jgi:ubiquinone/menaquinone biosynthesis C-methylase UbiE